MRFSRRSFLGLGIAAAAVAPTLASAGAVPKSVDIAARARGFLQQNASRIANTDIVALADFAAPSWQPRFHLIDMISGKVSSFLTAHGRGSDPAHTGWLKRFSNEVGSNASSSGAYATGALYEGKYGRSMRLTGLDPQNSNAEARAIVIHPAWYVGDDMLAKYGKLGRSEGCFALSGTGLTQVLAVLGPGRLLFAGKFDEQVG